MYTNAGRGLSLLLVSCVLLMMAAAPSVAAPTTDGSWRSLYAGTDGPSDRAQHTAVFDPVRGRTIVFGGWLGNLSTNEVWSLAGGEWTQLSPSGTPPTARGGHSAIYDPVRDRMIVFGGADMLHSPWVLNDVWALSLGVTPEWTHLVTSGIAPRERFFHSVIYDPERDQMIVFGGETYDGSTWSFINDTWALSLGEDPTWTQLTASGPETRYGAVAIHDPLRDRMVLFGGGTSAQLYNDVWALSLAGTPVWARLEPSGTPPRPRAHHAGIYDPVHDRLVAFGGTEGQYPGHPMNDVWSLSLAGTSQWIELRPCGGSPPARFFHSASYDATRNEMVVFGGASTAVPGAAGRFNDAWGLSWQSVSLVGSYDTPGLAGHVAVAGNLAFVADGSAGLQIIDVTHPATPTFVASYDAPGFASDVTVAGNLAFVVDWGLLKIIEVTNPAHPTLIGTYTIEHPGDSVPYPGPVAVADDLVLLADRGTPLRYGRLYIINIADPTHPTLVSSRDESDMGQAGGIAVVGGLAYLAVSMNGLEIIDISNPANPELIGHYFTWNGTDVAVEGDLAFMTDAADGLQIIDVSNPASPALVGSYDTPGNAYFVAVASNLCFVGDWGASLHIINISDPASPTLVVSYDTPGNARGIAVEGNLAFVADDDYGLQILKIGVPVSAAGACPADMVIPAYSTVPSISLVGFRITNMSITPASFDYALTSDGPATLVDKGNAGALSGITPLLAPGASYYPPEAGLVIPDIRTHTTQRVDYVVEGCAFSCETAITFEPPVPVLISAFDATAFDGGVRLKWDVFSDEVVVGFKIYRGLQGGPVSEITTAGLIPPNVRKYVDQAAVGGKTYRYTLAAVLADGSEVRSPILTVKAIPYALALHQNVPNPFNPTTTISFTLPQKSKVILMIYDVEGRRVRTLVDESVGEGRHEYVWDGRNASGSPVSSGLYFYRLAAGKQTLTKKMVLLK